MVRIDASDVQKPTDYGPIDCGFPRGFEERFAWRSFLGKGGFGKVVVVVEKRTGKEYACKSINKRLDVPNYSPQKQAAHLDNVRREIAVLRRLRGTLNVAQLKEALEDDESVHIVMELCRGGELWSIIHKLRHYSEETVASYMRAVLRTVAQCHAQNILHRDVKPGNFMLLDTDPLAPVKAIDFGLAVFFEPGKLPRRDLGLEGTPWFMSPETLSSQVGPPSDVWAAGVMAYQLLSGYLPFDDHKNRDAPALSKVWRAILTEDVVFKGKAWEHVSARAKDFVALLLTKDPESRPTAKEALQHPWLAKGHKEDRNKGAPLRHTVIQRIQRFGQGNILKRTIFDLIAQEIIRMAPETPDPSSHSQAAMPSAGLGPMGEGRGSEGEDSSMRAAQLLSSLKRRKSQRALAALAHGPGGGAMEWPPLIHRDHHSVHGGMEYYQARGESVHNGQQLLELAREGRPTSVHGGSSYWRVMRAAAAALKRKSGSGDDSYIRFVPRCDDERMEQRKAARLALDTSSRGTEEYLRLLKQCSSPSPRRLSDERTENGAPGQSGRPVGRAKAWAADGGAKVPSDDVRPEPAAADPGGKGRASSEMPKIIPETHPAADAGTGDEGSEQRVRGKHAYRQFLADQGQRRSLDQPQRPNPAAEAAKRRLSLSEDPRRDRGDLAAPSLHWPGSQAVAAGESVQPRMEHGGEKSAAESGEGRPARKAVAFLEASGPATRGEPEGAGPTQPPPGPRDPLKPGEAVSIVNMKDLMRKLNFTRDADGVSEAELAAGLHELGYHLRPDEMEILARQMDPHNSAGAISKSAFLASQIDWHSDDLRELWLGAARRVFADLEKHGRGKLSFAALMQMVREKIPEAEVEYAMEDALVEAGYADEEEMDFEGFLRILQADGANSLDEFEARHAAHNSLDGASSASGGPPALTTVAEES